MNTSKKQINRKKRKMHIRKTVSGTDKAPRASVFRSHNHIYVQFIDDVNSRTLMTASDKDLDTKKKIKPVDIAKEVGKVAAKKAQDLGITKVVFDRSGYKYHGRVKSLAESMRENGLKF